jgi:formamidopyrimidine-DNA glycosylase
MLEIPEATVISRQINESASGRTIQRVSAAASPHKLAWYFGDPAEYPGLLGGQMITAACAHGGLLELAAGPARIVAGDGTAIRYIGPNLPRPAKHQLLLDLDNGGALVFSVQMYGGIWAFEAGHFDNPYYQAAKERPSPLTAAFDETYFAGLLANSPGNLPAKALLATGQRIPGLGNGCLQDILFQAQIHPRRKLQTLADIDRSRIFRAIRETLADMVWRGGRDTERDLFGQPGGYRTLAGRLNAGQACPACGGPLQKEAYLGGSVYFCPGCQLPNIT